MSSFRPKSPSGVLASESPANTHSHEEIEKQQSKWRQVRPRRVRYRFLTTHEWTLLAGGIGALDKSDPEGHPAIIYPRNSMFFTTRGMPNGLYKDVVSQRCKYFWYYHAIAIVRWLCMLLQLLISAALTGIGSMQLTSTLPITVMAATNTVIAGLLALLHNSGLPDRHRINQAEFENVEDRLKRVVRTGIVEEHAGVDQVLMECFQAFTDAKVISTLNEFFSRNNNRDGPQSNDTSTLPIITAAPPTPQPVPRPASPSSTAPVKSNAPAKSPGPSGS